MPKQDAPLTQLNTVGDRKMSSGQAQESQNQDIVRQLIWDVASISVHLEEVRRFWARELGISGPQWMILMAVADLDRDNGVAVKDVSSMLHVDSSFITTQSKILEKNGLMRRTSSLEDARVVLMSLTDKASKKIAALSERRDGVRDYVFADYDERALKDFADQMAAVKTRLEKATRLLQADN